MAAQDYVGVISGTSVDGLDLALLRVADRPQVLEARTIPLPDALRQHLYQLGQQSGDDLDTLGTVDAELGDFIGSAVLEFLGAIGRTPAEIRAVGSHGQTVRHRPDGTRPFTLQIGDPNRIAETTGITTVADFRRRDIAAGGQGAPLVPPFHAALFSTPEENRAILNLGGIGNLTMLPADSAQAASGFDCGPGNALMDDWISHNRNMPFDADGAWAASGRIHAQLLQRLLDDAYLLRPPPKSTGREHYRLDWLEAHLRALPGGSPDVADVQATLCAFSAEAAARALAAWGGTSKRLLVCGGGRHNGTLMRELSARIPCPVQPTEAFGVDGDSIEAAAFAWLAHQTLNHLPGNEPAVTGARGYRVLGAVYPGGVGQS
ncbi:MAG: anhydro-N-acetylmuramic acid kinase [Pseudomonadales bacterium]